MVAVMEEATAAMAREAGSGGIGGMEPFKQSFIIKLIAETGCDKIGGILYGGSVETAALFRGIQAGIRANDI